MAFDVTVKVAVYHATAESGSPPSLETVVEKVGAAPAAIRLAYGRLGASRLLGRRIRPWRNIRLDTSNIGYVGLRHENIQ
jgi:hypothetical protein